MPWLRSLPPGSSSEANADAYTSICSSPTCSTMPMLATASKRSPAELAVVLDPDLHQIGHPRLLDPSPGPLGLRLGERDADHPRRRARAPRGWRSRPSHSPRRAPSCPAGARASCTPARSWRPAPPRGSRPRARRSRSCRSSTRQGRCGRSRWTRRSGGAPRAGRGRCCGGDRGAAAPPPAHAGAGSGPTARIAALASRSRSLVAIGGGSQPSSSRMTASRSSTSKPPVAYARPSPSWPGARRMCAMADGERTAKLGPPLSEGSRVPSQNSISNGRDGMVRASSRRSGPVSLRAIPGGYRAGVPPPSSPSSVAEYSAARRLGARHSHASTITSFRSSSPMASRRTSTAA